MVPQGCMLSIKNMLVIPTTYPMAPSYHDGAGDGLGDTYRGWGDPMGNGRGDGGHSGPFSFSSDEDSPSLRYYNGDWWFLFL